MAIGMGVPTDELEAVRHPRIAAERLLNADGWSCPSCGTESGSMARYCFACGEQRLPSPESTLRRTWQMWAGTLRLLLRPGALTVAYIGGRRRSLVPPLTLFLAINVVFFVAQSLSGIVLMGVPLSSHLRGHDYSAWVQARVDQRSAALGIDEARYAERFDARQVTLAKSSVVTMVPLLALACALIYSPRAMAHRREWALHWATHWAFALHFFAFALLFLSVFFPLVLASLLALDWAGLRFSEQQIDLAVIVSMSLVLGTYVSRAGSSVHRLSLARRASASVLMVASLFLIQRLHGWAVLLATLLTT